MAIVFSSVFSVADCGFQIFKVEIRRRMFHIKIMPVRGCASPFFPGIMPGRLGIEHTGIEHTGCDTRSRLERRIDIRGHDLSGLANEQTWPQPVDRCQQIDGPPRSELATASSIGRLAASAASIFGPKVSQKLSIILKRTSSAVPPAIAIVNRSAEPSIGSM